MNKKCIILIFFSVFSTEVFAVIPDWYNEPTKDTDIHFYGTGSGLSINEAIAVALHNISNRLTSNNNNLRVNFPNYELEKVEKDGKHFYIILSVAKAELFNKQIKDLEDINRRIKDNINFIEDKNDFVKLIKLIEIENIITEAKNKIKTANLIDKFNDKEYIKYYNTIIEGKNKLLNNFKVEIVFLNDSIANLKEDISTFLRKNNIEITNKSNNILYVSTITKNELINGEFFVTVIFQLKLVCDGKLANYSSYNYSSHSIVDFNEAMKNCINKFKKDIINDRIKFPYDE